MLEHTIKGKLPTDILSAAETASLLGTTERNLARQRVDGGGPASVKVRRGKHLVAAYRAGDVIDWLGGKPWARRTTQNTFKKAA